jgi:hypothetical protein
MREGLLPSSSLLFIPLHFKPIELYWFIWGDACFLAADINLIVDTIYSFKVGQE